MSNGVEFEEDQFGMKARMAGSGLSGYGTLPSQQANSAMVRWLIKKGIVKSANVGRIVLLVVVIINIILSYMVVKYFI